MPLADIESIVAEHRLDVGKRRAQHLLATEVVELVHGREEAARTHAEHQSLRAPTLSSLMRKSQSGHAQSSEHDAAPRRKLPRSLVYDTSFSRILYHAGLVGSKSEGSRLIRKGGAYVATIPSTSTATEQTPLNFVPIKHPNPSIDGGLVIDGFLILRIGKWKVSVIEVIEDTDFDANGFQAPGWAEHKESKQSSG